MAGDMLEVFVSRDEIAQMVEKMGAQISREYEGRELFLIGVLKGAVIFLADLVRCLSADIRVEFDFMAVSSYGNSSSTSGIVRLLKDLDCSIEGRDVLVVEDIIDTGLTLRYLYKNLADRHPRSLRVATLLDKPERRKVDFEPDYRGLVIPDLFVVGYGLDFAGRYRNLPDIYKITGVRS